MISFGSQYSTDKTEPAKWGVGCWEYLMMSSNLVGLADLAGPHCLALLVLGCIFSFINSSCTCLCFWKRICIDALLPSQQFFIHVQTISCLPGLNEY